MNFTDEQLSAFLDHELPQAEMEAVREKLAVSEELVDRLAELAEIDSIIACTYGGIDELPLPTNIVELLARASTSTEPTIDLSMTADLSGASDIPRAGGNISQLPLAKKWLNRMQPYLTMAASVVLAVGVGLGVLMSSNSPHQLPAWPAVATVLDKAASGTTHSVGNSSITLQLSFQNPQGDYCRVYYQAYNEIGRARQHLACRQQGQWQLKASVPVQSQSGELYRTASGGSALDDVIDQQLSAGPFDSAQEQQLIRQGW